MSTNTNITSRPPLLSCCSPDDTLSSFPSLRERNMRTLYGDTRKISTYTDNDKSPKGSVDTKIRPLVDLINCHPEYVTLSSCSGRVAMFDPSGGEIIHEEGNDGDDGSDDHYEVFIATPDDGEEGRTNQQHHKQQQIKVKGTKISGKGRGKWIFVTHDILPDLGQQIIHSLQTVGQERIARQRSRSLSSTNNDNDDPPITFKHEPPLLHIAASSLAAGKKLLHIAKSICAMRESGLVVTDQRVTVELRTTGTLLCLPLMIQLLMMPKRTSSSLLSPREPSSISLVPNEQYLASLADMANERMVQNEKLLEKLCGAVQDGLFGTDPSATVHQKGASSTNDNEEVGDNEYKVSLQSLPSLNLWKTAAVVLPTRNGNTNNNSKDDDLDVLAFGGQGIGPDIDMNGVITNGKKKAPTCKRWDAVFRLARRDCVWSDRWEVVSVSAAESSANNNSVSSTHAKSGDLKGTSLVTNAGIFQVHLTKSLGAREGHCACVLPLLKKSTERTDAESSRAVLLFGGRTGGPLSPSNDLFLFALSKHQSGLEQGMFGRPIDVRGTPPEPRFGHTMTAIRNKVGSSPEHGEPVAVVAGGTGISFGGSSAVSLSSVHVLSRITESGESDYAHFIWDRVSDMPSPRSYHTTTFVQEKNSNDCMFVFGGIAEADDPFGSFDDTNRSGEMTNSPWFKLSLFGKDTAAQAKNGIVANVDQLPSLIGSSVAKLALNYDDIVLLVGGAKSPSSSDSEDNAQGPLGILTLKSDKNGSANELVKANISSIKWVNTELTEESSGHEDVDFGTCVHHCLVALPKLEGISSTAGNDTASAIIVGGGVPSFSFGQSYARSYVVNVEKALECNKATTKPSQDRITHREHAKSQLPAPTKHQTINGKPTVPVDVIYVAARHAKEVKNELESLDFLDKRYKMIKVKTKSSVDHVGNNPTKEGASSSLVENLIAIPVTNRCTQREGGATSSNSFERLVVRSGKEMVPFSSSAMGKMKQQRKGPT